MAMVDELHAQVDQSKAALLLYNDDGKIIKITIRKNDKGQYTRTISYPEGPSLFPQRKTEMFNAWTHLLADLNEFQITSDQWHIE